MGETGTSNDSKHRHPILSDGLQDRIIVPPFDHEHDNDEPDHRHFIVEDERLIPPHVLAFWDERWERWPKKPEAP